MTRHFTEITKYCMYTRTVKLKQIANNIFMFVCFASSGTVSSICITYWTFFTSRFAYKVLLAAGFDNSTDTLAIQVGTVSVGTRERLKN